MLTMDRETIYGLLHPSIESQPVFLAIILVIAGVLGSYYNFQKSCSNARLPPGSFGLPLFGETIGFLRSLRQDKTQEWVENRLVRYGPIFKTSLMGKPTVVMIGSSGNRFVFTTKDDTITANQPGTFRSIMGKYNIFELTGINHKLIRDAINSFLKPESLHRYVGGMDSLVKQQIFQELDRKDFVVVVPLMKRITFNVTCAILFALPPGEKQDQLFEDFKIVLRGVWALQLNFPTTTFYQSMAARKRICDYFSTLLADRRKVADGKGNSENDVASIFVRLRNENGEDLPEEMLIDNLMTLMIGSHDTSTTLLTLLVRQLARDKAVYRRVLEEQEKILLEKGRRGGKLTWSDIQKMKYTWCVSQEVMRITPPAFGNFRTAIADTSFGGFDIPKGWQIFWVSSGTHMNESIFPEPEKFDPSRFEPGSKTHPPYTYIPFGAGAHVCPGNEFARIEVLLVMHYLVINYEWSEMIPNEPITRQPMPLPARDLPIKLQRRRYHEDICS